MALGDTIYVFDIELANSDSGVYEKLLLRIARHQSETAERMLMRVLAYCLEYTEGITLSNGISEPDEPAIAVRDLTGVLRTWIDVGAPEAPRLHRASKAAPRVAVYTHRMPNNWQRGSGGSGFIALMRLSCTRWTSIGFRILPNASSAARHSH